MNSVNGSCFDSSFSGPKYSQLTHSWSSRLPAGTVLGHACALTLGPDCLGLNPSSAIYQLEQPPNLSVPPFLHL